MSSTLTFCSKRQQGVKSPLKDIKNRRKSILLVLFLVLVSTLIGITAAYLYHHTKSINNNLTVGDVKIDLIEPKWDKLSPEDKIVYPGKSVIKDPQIKNIGNTPIYVYIKVLIPRAEIRTVTKEEKINDSSMSDLFSFTTSGMWTLVDEKTSSDSEFSEKVYGYIPPLQPSETTVPSLFSSVRFADIVEGTLPMNTELEIKLTAMAIQTEYLETQTTAPVIKLREAYNLYFQNSD